MPSLAILIAMRDKNIEGTMKSLQMIKSSQLKLVHKIA